MITSLHISNYALISSIDIEFGKALNIITGETGAGKSIMLGALALILGGRADMKTVRDTSKKTVVEAVLDISNHQNINKILADADVDVLGNQCILRRELTSKGGSRAFINDTPVTLQMLKEVAMLLIDIHSQHQNLMLADNGYQLSIIDSLAGNDDLLKQYGVAYRNYRSALKDYTQTRDMITRNQAEAEYLTYQYEQLEDLNLQLGEQEQLEHDREIMANITQIKSHISGALENLSGSQSITVSLMRAADEMQHLSEIFEDAADLADRLKTAKIEIQDIVDSIAQYDESLSANPAELDAIEQRLGQIYSLETKHHVDTDAQLIALRDQLKTQLETINNGDETLAQLEDKAKKAKKAAVLIAREISARRTETATQFAAQLKDRAMPLGMNNIRCEIALSTGKLSPTGIDSVEFMFAFNKNQPLMPIGKTASGGEISRVILAIKSIVVEHMHLPTIIFDEVDTGVSGDIANKMAELMDAISKHTQVITITHLPQVAAHGQMHFKVYKHDDDNSTLTNIQLLNKEEREAELALMLSGSTTNESALATARTLIHNNNPKFE
jgi:DNA repair protein RecN (Recombination protein N)